ncbi:hypothetical protein ACIBVL_15855 [Streptomyces sp. NPDC049687]|uniref:hypothetical protein n=1 Tax=Streptomyces sp. NPDC049687 TaxID=3365596 RepID=UPI0037B461A6
MRTAYLVNARADVDDRAHDGPQYELYEDAYAELVEEPGRACTSGSAYPSRSWPAVLPPCPNGSALGDANAWMDIFDTVTAHIAGPVRVTGAWPRPPDL